ncbi:MAG: aminotransferase class V-fold PLP-dependent enzyme [Rhizobiaceae bacterium]|nr:aminotransferase class V-fold PLP-dependent enzyme [Rhizobiaceae bacterium]
MPRPCGKRISGSAITSGRTLPGVTVPSGAAVITSGGGSASIWGIGGGGSGGGGAGNQTPRSASGGGGGGGAARAGGYIDAGSGGVVPPLQNSTTFVLDLNCDPLFPDNIYGRDQNDQVRLAESVIAELEGAEDSLLFASGMAAISTLFSSLKRGQSLIVQSGMYWGTTAWARDFCRHREVNLIEADSSDTDGFVSLIQTEKPDMVFIEVPSNPWILTSDIEVISKAARSCSAIMAVDATAATPILMQPISLGADFVMHSATKAINGHSDVIAGVLSCADANSDVWAFVKHERHGAGAILSAHSAWMLIRGMRTLPLRLERMCSNAMAIAKFLDRHEKIDAVWYPGIATHQGHKVASRQMPNGFGYLMSFLIKGSREDARNFCRHLTGIHRATSLGGVESLVEHRATVEGELTGCLENLIRLSVGIEDAADLIDEIDTALANI